jgi:hypothetical protein
MTELLISSELVNRKIGLQMLAALEIPEILDFIFFHVVKNIASKKDVIEPFYKLRMILHFILFIKKPNPNGFSDYYVADIFIEPGMNGYRDPSVLYEKKGGVWLGLEDLEKLNCSRDTIEYFGITSSIDEWETTYNSGMI